MFVDISSIPSISKANSSIRGHLNTSANLNTNNANVGTSIAMTSNEYWQTNNKEIRGEMMVDENTIDFKNDTTAAFLKQYGLLHLYKQFKHLDMELGIFYHFIKFL